MSTGHQIAWVALGLRRAAAERRVTLPADYARQVAAEALRVGDHIAVTGLGDGIVIHTAPTSRDRLPLALGYADRRGQWHRDGRRHESISGSDAPAPVGASLDVAAS